MADAIIPPPSEEEYNRGPRVQTNSGGIGYYIPPEIKQLGRNALDLANMMDPVQGIMAGMRDSGRAFNPELSPEERKRAAVSAALETTFAAAPVAAAKLMKAPAKAALVDALTLTGAPTSMADDISDPSRRAFMKGAAATAGVAALAPEAITEALEKVPAAVKRVKPPINPIDMFAKNIKVLRDEMNAAYDAADELAEDLPPADPIGAPTRPFDEAIAEAEKLHMDFDATTEMDMRELISEIGAKEIAGAADESLEELSQALTDFRMYSEEEYIEQMIPLAEEIQKRGLLEVKDKYGIAQYPYARTVVEDVRDHLKGDKPFFYEPPDAGMKMTDDGYDENLVMKLDDLFDEWRSGNISNNELRKRVAEQGAEITNPRLMPQGDPYNVEVAMPDGRILPIYDLPINRNSTPVEDLVARDQEDRNRELIRQALVREFEAGQEKGLSQAEIDEAISQKRYQLEKKYGIDFSKADGGEMRKGVGSLSEIARHMTKGGVVASSTEYRRSLYGTESSGGALDAVNKRTGALGASQAMPETLEEFKEETGRDFTRDQFKKNAGLQEAFQNWYEQKTLDYIANNGLDEYIGKMVKGVPVTLSGMMAVAHLGGNYGLKQFLETDGGYDPSDNKKNPEQGTRLSDYLQKHGGLNVYSDDSLSEDAKEELVMSQPVAPRNPIYSDPDYSNPINYMRPVARPTDLAPVFQNELNESPRPVARPQQEASLQEKYSTENMDNYPEGIARLLIGTTAEPLLPRQFQQGSPSGAGR